MVLWLGAWVWLSGLAERTGQAIVQGTYELAAGQGFVVKNILVQGRKNIDADVLKALLNMEEGDPLFAFDPDEAQLSLSRLAWVKDVQVARQLPDTIIVNLIEREPLALWQHQGHIRLIDTEGTTIGNAKLKEFAHLPIIVGEDAPEHGPALLQLLDAEPVIREQLEAATRVGSRRWDLRLKNGIDVRLPEEDMGLALRRLAAAQEEDGLFDKDLTVIDAREPFRLTVRTRPGAVHHYKAGLRNDI